MKISLNLPRGLFNDAYLSYLHSYEKRYEVYYGGAGSGKSVFVAQKLLLKAMKEKRKILVVRKVMATHSTSCWQLFIDILSRWEILKFCKVNKSNFVIELPNGSSFVFKGLDDSEKIKSIVGITDIWIEEATEINEEEFLQLDLRLRAKVGEQQIVLSFNPISKANWCYKRWFERPQDENTFILKTTYKDNRFLPESYIASLEKMMDTNPYYYRVYALGEFASLDKLVYSNWKICDFDFSELTYLGVVDDFESFTFVSKYNACGNFKIKGMYTPQAKQYLVLGNIVYFNGFAGFIHSIEIEMADGEESIVVNGYDMCGYLARRIVWDTVNYNGNLETFIRKLVDENCISTSEARAIPFLSLGDVSGLTETIEKQVSYMNLLEVLEETALAYDVGFSVDFSPKDKKLIFNVYKGADRTAGTANPLIFNRDYENILSETYINSTKQLKNVALVGGMGEGTARTFVSLGDAVGLGRYEMFVDAKDLQQSDLTDTEYKAQLFQRGTEKLADCYIVESFEGEANTNADFSFSLGDKVSIIDKSLNIRLDTRITAIERIIERKGTTTNLTFGNCVPTIYKKMGVY